MPGYHGRSLPPQGATWESGVGVLLVVFANIANLFLVRAANRRREVALRMALGASRWRLGRQLFTESLLLAFCGAILGSALARSAVGFFFLLSPETSIPTGYDFHLGPGTLSFTAVMTLLGAVVFGFVPALSADLNVNEALKEGARSLSEGRKSSSVRNALVVVEMALAFVLVVGSVLCIRGFFKARAINLGFDAHNVVSASLDLVPNGYAPQAAKIFDRQLRDRLSRLTKVSDVALVTSLPLGQDNISIGTLDVDGYVSTASEDRQVSFDIVSGGYFSTMRIGMIAGRDFTDADDSTTQNVAIINESMARRYWAGLDNPVGRRFNMAAGVAPSSSFVVVGVVKDSKYRSLTESSTPIVYLAYQQRPLASLFMAVVLRSTSDARPLLPILRNEIHALDPTVEPLELRTMEVAIQPAFSGVKAAGTFLVVLGTTALLLASLGLYAITAYAVACRTREIGIRMALGCTRIRCTQRNFGPRAAFDSCWNFSWMRGFARSRSADFWFFVRRQLSRSGRAFRRVRLVMRCFSGGHLSSGCKCNTSRSNRHVAGRLEQTPTPTVDFHREALWP